MSGIKIILQVMGAILILVSGKFMMELIGIGFLVGAGFLSQKRVVIRKVGRT